MKIDRSPSTVDRTVNIFLFLTARETHANMKSLSIISCSLTVLASLKGAKGWSSSPSSPLQGVATRPRQLQQQRTTVLLPLQASPKSEAPEIDLGTLKIRLTEYFEKRKQLNADVLAKEYVLFLRFRGEVLVPTLPPPPTATCHP